MTREEQISIASCAYGSRGSSVDFTVGAKWADSNPKSPWISVEDDLPCNHKELCEDDSYTKKVLVTLSWEDDPEKRHIGMRDMCNKIGLFNVGWYWQNTAHYKVTHWMVLPRFTDRLKRNRRYGEKSINNFIYYCIYINYNGRIYAKHIRGFGKIGNILIMLCNYPIFLLTER